MSILWCNTFTYMYTYACVCTLPVFPSTVIHRDPLVASFKEIRTQPGEMGEPVPQLEILHVTMVTVKMFQPSTVRHNNTHITYHIWTFNVAPEDRPIIDFQVLC